MEKVVLKAKKRDVVGKQVRALRRAGELPAVLYGRHIKPLNIALDAHSATQILAKLTSSSLVTVEVDGNGYPALVREKQRNFIKNTLLHVDFLAVSLTEKINANVSIQLEGVAPAVKDFNAILVPGLTELEVECLPTDLPERIVVDISGLKEIGDGLYVRDLIISDKVEVLNDPDELIVVATAMAAEEVEAAAEGETVEPEVIEKGKKEEEKAE